MIKTVILTCIGGNLGGENVRLCQQAGARVIGVNASPCKAAILADEFLTVPTGNDPDYIPTLLRLVRKFGVELIIPGSDEEALVLSQNKPAFQSAGAMIACVDTETLEILNDKGRTYSALEGTGVGLAEWIEVHNQQQLNQVVSEMVQRLGSVVVKPSGARGGRGVFIVDAEGPFLDTRVGGREIICNYSTFERVSRSISVEDFPMVVMERLYPPHHDLDLLAWQGEAIGIVPRKWHNFPSLESGIEVIDAPELMEIGRIIIQKFNLSWLYDVDLMKNGNGDWVLLEINPRMSGSVSILGCLGINMFAHILALSNGERLRFTEPVLGVTVATEQILRGTGRGSFE